MDSEKGHDIATTRRSSGSDYSDGTLVEKAHDELHHPITTVAEESEEGLLSGRAKSLSRPRTTATKLAISVVLVAVSVFSVGVFFLGKSFAIKDPKGVDVGSSHNKAGAQPTLTLLGDCGHNYTTARHSGCIFDVMLGHWVSPPCFHYDIHQEYLAAHPEYEWFWDKQMTESVPFDEVAVGDYFGVWTSLEFHFHHCLYLWQVQMRAYTTRGPLADNLFSYEHTQHCAGVVREQDYPGRDRTFIETGYTRCVLPTWD